MSTNSGQSNMASPLEKLIPVINKLQDVFNAIGGGGDNLTGIDLPQIVVVGSQSAGKSSVLEAIVGRDFLPRGSGIVTRRPLVLQLIHLPEVKGEASLEWGEFLHKPNEMFYDFDKIREEIERETDRITGKNKGVSPIPINLKIYSSQVLNLTLVDLPGMTRVPIGDQPPDIEIQIRNMIRQYISRPNAIVLAITAANTDLSNSDALQLAKDVDPEGERTVGVLTKIDIMDKGTDALDMLLGRVVPLKLGFVGVVNRSQLDINQKKQIREALKYEAEYFSSHSLYRTIASRCGTPYLSKTLNRILIQHIRNCLPDLKTRINKLLSESQQEMLSYGNPLYDGKSSQGALLLQIITSFSTAYRDAIDGKLSDAAVTELYGGARISYIFNEMFAKCIDTMDATEGLTLNDIRTAIRNATGPKGGLFIPESSFELLVKGLIARLEEPSIQCVERVHDELQRIVNQVDNKEMLRFTVLRERVLEVVNALLVRFKAPTKEMITNVIAIELAFINTNHPDFIGGEQAASRVREQLSGGNPSNPGQVPTNTSTTTITVNTVNNPANPGNKGTAGPQGTGVATGGKPGGPGNMPGPPPNYSTKPNTQPGMGTSPKPNPDPNNSMNGNSNDPAYQSSFFSAFFGGSGNSRTTNPAPPANPNNPNSGGSSGGARETNPFASPQSPGTGSHNNAAARHNQHMMMHHNRSAPSNLEQVPVTLKPTDLPSEKETFETELIKCLLVSYFNVVRKNVKDLVPKSTMHFLVNKSKESIQNELVANLYKEELFDELLSESPTIRQKREACKATMEILRRAAEILNEVRDFQIV